MGGDILGWVFEHVFPWILLAFIFIVCPLGIYACVQNERRPTFELKKDDWACARYQEKEVTTYVQSGKVMVPMTTYSKVCTNWVSTTN